VILAVYIDGILVTESNIDSIEKAKKKYLKTQFVIKDISKLKYLGLKLLTLNME